jgi:hypothetical protein
VVRRVPTKSRHTIHGHSRHCYWLLRACVHIQLLKKKIFSPYNFFKRCIVCARTSACVGTCVRACMTPIIQTQSSLRNLQKFIVCARMRACMCVHACTYPFITYFSENSYKSLWCVRECVREFSSVSKIILSRQLLQMCACVCVHTCMHVLLFQTQIFQITS